MLAGLMQDDYQLTLKHVIEIEGESKPACVAESVVLLLP